MTKHPANEYQPEDDAAALGFNKWFMEDLYGRFSYRIEHFLEDIKIEDYNQRRDILIKWLNSAYNSGYECAMYAKLDKTYDKIEEHIEETNELLKEVDEYLEK
jgi:hypothetical protein